MEWVFWNDLWGFSNIHGLALKAEAGDRSGLEAVMWLDVIRKRKLMFAFIVCVVFFKLVCLLLQLQSWCILYSTIRPQRRGSHSSEKSAFNPNALVLRQTRLPPLGLEVGLRVSL
jgi:hypothetical protein